MWFAGRQTEARAKAARALADAGRDGAGRVEGALTQEAGKRLQGLLETLPYEPQPSQVGKVRQETDLFRLQVDAARADPRYADLAALLDAYLDLLRGLADGPEHGWLASYRPTEVHVQRYAAGSVGISPHLDRSTFTQAISIFCLGSPVEFGVYREREGPPVYRFPARSGDLILLRAPGFGGDPDAPRPFHSVSGPERGVRCSVTYRATRSA